MRKSTKSSNAHLTPIQRRKLKEEKLLKAEQKRLETQMSLARLQVRGPMEVMSVTDPEHSAMQLINQLKAVIRPGEAVQSLPMIIHGRNDADAILTYCGYENQRPLVSLHVKEFALIIKKGEWNQYSTIKLALLNNTLYLINGRHRLHAIRETNTAHAMTFQVTRASSMEDVQQMYNVEDVETKLRTTTDMYQSHSIEKSNVPQADIQNISSAIYAMGNGFNEKNARNVNNLTAIALTKFVDFWAEDAKEFKELLKGGDGTMTSRWRNSASMGVALIALHFNPAGTPEGDRLRQFIQNVAQSVTQPGTPEHVLAKYFKDHYLQDEGVAHWSRKVAGCVNDAITGQKRYKITPIRDGELTPIRIYGENSPYDGVDTIYFSDSTYEHTGNPFTTERPVRARDIRLSTDGQPGRPKMNTVDDDSEL